MDCPFCITPCGNSYCAYEGIYMKKIEEGRNLGMSNAEYHGDSTHLSSSGLKLILKDPDDFYRKYILGEREESKSFFDFGTYMHALILEPETVEDEFAIFGGASRRGKLYEEFIEKNKDKILITRAEKLQAEKMMEGYRANETAVNLIKDGLAEDTYAAEIDGVKVKARTDYISGDYIADVKTTSSPLTRMEIMNTIEKYSYDLSAALYLDVCNAHKSEEEKVKKFIFIFTNKKNHETLVVEASDELIERGRSKYLYAIKKYKSLTEDGFFDINKKKIEKITI